MTNPVLMLVRNNLELTARAIYSVNSQSVPNRLLIVDNDSNRDCRKWLREHVGTLGYDLFMFRPQLGVSEGWNFGLSRLFNDGAEHVLVVSNDVILPKWYYEVLLECNAPFVTGSETRDRSVTVKGKPYNCTLSPTPDFATYLIRKHTWKVVGEFDSRMVHYASDCDYHVRAHRAGIPLCQAVEAEFYHERSSTLRNAGSLDRKEIETQANADRAVFQRKYGCLPGTQEYSALFGEEVVRA